MTASILGFVSEPSDLYRICADVDNTSLIKANDLWRYWGANRWH
jgi:hypothetical protein